MVRISNGQMLVVGGLIDKTDDGEDTKVFITQGQLAVFRGSHNFRENLLNFLRNKPHSLFLS